VGKFSNSPHYYYHKKLKVEQFTAEKFIANNSPQGNSSQKTKSRTNLRRESLQQTVHGKSIHHKQFAVNNAPQSNLTASFFCRRSVHRSGNSQKKIDRGKIKSTQKLIFALNFENFSGFRSTETSGGMSSGCHGNREHIFWLLVSYRAAEKVKYDFLSSV
jgi:hypothetical protein